MTADAFVYRMTVLSSPAARVSVVPVTVAGAVRKFCTAPNAVEAPVPPSATARSVMPVTDPPVMLTEDDACVAIVPSPNVVRAVPASASSTSVRP